MAVSLDQPVADFNAAATSGQHGIVDRDRDEVFVSAFELCCQPLKRCGLF